MNVLHVYGFGVHDMDSVCEGEKEGERGEGEREREERGKERERERERREGGRERENACRTVYILLRSRKRGGR